MRSSPQSILMDRLFVNALSGTHILVVGEGASAATQLGGGEGRRLVLVDGALWQDYAVGVRSNAVAGIVLDPDVFNAKLRDIVKCATYPVVVGSGPESSSGDALLRRLSVWRLPVNYTEGLGDSFSKFANGGHSIAAGVQLAYLLGAASIGIVGGQDMLQVRGTPEAPVPVNQEMESVAGRYEGWAQEMGRTAAVMRSEGRRLVYVNDTPRSPRCGVPVLTLDEWDAGRVCDALGTEAEWDGGGVPGVRAQDVCYAGARNIADVWRYEPVPEAVEAERGYCVSKGVFRHGTDSGIPGGQQQVVFSEADIASVPAVIAEYGNGRIYGVLYKTRKAAMDARKTVAKWLTIEWVRQTPDGWLITGVSRA